MVENVENVLKDHDVMIHELKENQIKLSLLVERHDNEIEEIRKRKNNIVDKIIIAILSALSLVLVSYVLSGGVQL